MYVRKSMSYVTIIPRQLEAHYYYDSMLLSHYQCHSSIQSENLTHDDVYGFITSNVCAVFY